MRSLAIVSVLIVLATLLSGVVQGALISKTYEFKDGVILEMNSASSDGLRLDSIRFAMPPTIDGKLMRTGGLVEAEIAVSNTSDRAHKTGIAIALFDDQGRLVGVASGGSKLAGLKPNRRKVYKLIFENLNAEAFTAATFQISVEARP